MLMGGHTLGIIWSRFQILLTDQNNKTYEIDDPDNGAQGSITILII
jgi:hypothetical protein